MNNNDIIPKYIFDNLSQKDTKFLEIITNYYLQLKNVSNLQSELNLEVDKLNNLKYLFQKNCNHVWEMDDAQYQTPTSWTCKICGEYK